MKELVKICALLTIMIKFVGDKKSPNLQSNCDRIKIDNKHYYRLVLNNSDEHF